ncbi:MAG: class B sortase [Oscillospiraceae bacterium]|jgi:sortase B|nr:class B sortase [Oscillospiraceae bacterium]
MAKKSKAKDAIRVIIVFLLLGVCAFSGWKVYEGWSEYRRGDKEKDRLEQYEPETKPNDDDAENKSVAELIARYPDVVGWLKLEDSVISYPFVQTANNDDYLHRTLEGEKLSAGTLFLDYRSNADFSDFNSVIYGHLMQNGSMFGTLKEFANQKAFWDSHKRGWIYLPSRTLELEFFAIITVYESDRVIYGVSYPDKTSKENFLAHVKQTANRWRDIGVSAGDSFVCLSTCTSATSSYRYVLVGKIN